MSEGALWRQTGGGGARLEDDNGLALLSTGVGDAALLDAPEAVALAVALLEWAANNLDPDAPHIAAESAIDSIRAALGSHLYEAAEGLAPPGWWMD